VKRPRGRREIFDPIADFVVEDILSVSDDQLLAEAAEESGSSGALAAEFDAITLPAMSNHNTIAIKQSPSVLANGTPQQDYREAVASLDDLIVDDILSMSDDQLLAEAAEDYGNPGALAAEFDAITLPAMSSHNNSAIEQNDAPPSAAAPGIIRRKFVRLSPAIQAATAMLSEWLAAPLRRRAALGAFAILLLVAPGIYLLLVERSLGPDHPGLTRAFRPDATVAVPSNRAERPMPPASEPGAREAQIAPIPPEVACARDTERMARLRADPTIGAIAQFERELTCERIRPQLRRLRESVGQ
jgi:hypothetical protein